MGDKIIAWIWAKMPGLVSWAGGLSEGQLIGAAVGGLLLLYALYTALYNAGLVIGAALSDSHAADSSPRGGALGRMISASTAWDDEPYEEWMAEEYAYGTDY